MGEVTHEQVNLMLRLYDIRREPRLREARDWFIREFKPSSAEDVLKLAPANTQENAFMRMVLGYWDMVANIVNRGLIDEEFFFENTNEQWVVWERAKPAIAGWREARLTMRQCSPRSKNIAGAWKLGARSAHPAVRRRCANYSRRCRKPHKKPKLSAMLSVYSRETPQEPKPRSPGILLGGARDL